MPMWRGDVTFGEGWAVYAGEAADQAPHAHAALQIAIAVSGRPFTIALAGGAVISGEALLVAPLVSHRLLARDGEVVLVYLDARTPLARRLLEALSPARAGPVPEPYRQALGRGADRLPTILADLDDLDPRTSPLDRRLAKALAALAEDMGAGAIERAARSAGLSAPRLRALAQAQLRLPLSQWLLWRKLESASRAIAAGDSLAQAALAGGFADQSHLARIMRRMFGVTTGQAAAPLRKRSVQEARRL